MTDINVFYTCDNKFSRHCAVSIASLLYNAANDDILHIFIIHNDIDNKNQNKITSIQKIKKSTIEFIQINDTLFADYKTPDYINSRASLYRYLIPKLKPEIKKAIYLDCDTIVCQSLSELYNIDLNENYIAGVEDWHFGMAIKRLKLNTTIKEPYFNSGVLLINCEKWRADNLFKKLIEKTNNLNPKMLEQLDQDAINIVSRGKSLIIPPKYNLLSCYSDEFAFTSYSLNEMKNAERNPAIIHFSARIKPWMIENFPLNEFAYQYYKYLQLTPYYSKVFGIHSSIFNPKVRKYYKKISSNTIIKLFLDLPRLFIDIFKLIISLLCSFKYYKKFKKETSL